MSHRIFVYGTLQRGLSNSHRMKGARHLGAAVTKPDYTLHDMGPWPGIVAGGDTAIHGELYLVDLALLAALDEFEGGADLFYRAPIELASGCAEAYFLDEKVARQGTKVASGRWWKTH